jgi:hypothetical protein
MYVIPVVVTGFGCICFLARFRISLWLSCRTKYVCRSKALSSSILKLIRGPTVVRNKLPDMFPVVRSSFPFPPLAGESSCSPYYALAEVAGLGVVAAVYICSLLVRSF